MKNKKYIVILTILIAFIVPLQSFAKSFDLNIKYDGKNISMESETPDTSWTLSNLLPGQSDTSSVTIKNSGVETVTLETQISIEENNGLLDAIDLTVTNKAGTEVYTGKYTDLKTIEVSLAPGATETYTVKTSMRVDAGNEYQNKQYKLRFNFVATADELAGTLTIRYVDQDGKDIEPPTVETNYITETYDYTNQTPKDFSSIGYTYTGKVDGKLSGNYDINGSEIVYHYEKYGNVVVKHIVDNEFEDDGNNKVLKQFTDTKVVGKSYNYASETFPGYEFTGKIDGEATGTYNEDSKTIIFHYNKIEEKETGRVIVLYVDENGKELDRKVDTDVVGNDYSYKEDEIKKVIPGYKYITYEGELTGQYKKDDTIIYCKYESVKYGNLIILCIDENNTVIKRTVTTEEVGTEYNLGKVGDEIPGYEFLGVEGDTSGKYKIEDTIVTYRYKRIKKGPSTNVVTEPKTGDEIVKYICIAAVAVVILIIIFIIMKKNKKDNN